MRLRGDRTVGGRFLSPIHGIHDDDNCQTVVDESCSKRHGKKSINKRKRRRRKRRRTEAMKMFMVARRGERMASPLVHDVVLLGRETRRRMVLVLPPTKTDISLHLKIRQQNVSSGGRKRRRYCSVFASLSPTSLVPHVSSLFEEDPSSFGGSGSVHRLLSLWRFLFFFLLISFSV